MSVPVLARRHRAYIVFVWLSLAVGFAVVLAAATLLRLESVWPPAVRPVVQARSIPDTVWAASWSQSAMTPAQSQQAGVAVLVGVLAALAAVAASMAVVNVLSMAATRRVKRRREMAVRSALGAQPGHFLADRVRENAFLYGGGLAFAVLGAVALAAVMKTTWPAGLAPPGRLAAGTAAVIVAIAALGAAVLVPAARTRSSIHPVLAGGTATADRAGSRHHAVPVVAEIALALVLAGVTALLLRYGRTNTETSDLDLDGVIALDLTASEPSPADRAASFAQLLDRVHELPGVRSESIASPGAWLGMGTRDRVLVECGACARGNMMMPIQPAYVLHHAVSSGFFEALGVPVVAGRSFDRTDTFDTAHVAIVNETFAARSFDERGPIGRRVRVGGFGGDWYTIVGVVRDIRARGMGAPRDQAPALYLSTQQQPPSAVGLAVRTTAEPDVLAARVERVAGAVAGATVVEASTLSDRFDRALAPLRWFGAMFAFTAAAALALALHGVAMAMRAQTQARRRELAIRSAVGAHPLRIVGLVMRRAIRTLALGTLFGWIGVWTAGRLIQMRIGGMPTLDFPTILPLTAGLAIAAASGAIVPAVRAAMSPPSEVFQDS